MCWRGKIIIKVFEIICLSLSLKFPYMEKQISLYGKNVTANETNIPLRRQQTCGCSKYWRSRNAEQSLRNWKQNLKQTGKTGKGEIGKKRTRTIYCSNDPVVKLTFRNVKNRNLSKRKFKFNSILTKRKGIESATLQD